MPIPPLRKKIDVEEATRLHDEEGLSATQIAQRLGFTAPSVCRALRRHGVTLRPARSHRKVPHGERLYGLWLSIRARCTRPRDRLYPRYGAKGYSVCREWEEFWPFYDWAIASGYKPRRNIEVVERSKVFSPRTCRWITSRQRMARDGSPGGRTPKHVVTAFGETKSAPEWARDPRCAVSVELLRSRLLKGVPPDLAITLPPDRSARLPVDRRRKRTSVSPRRLHDWDQIVRLYLGEDLTVPEIAQRVGANADRVRKGLKERGVWSNPDLPQRALLQKTFYLMHRRCSDENDLSFAYYGGRGARVCREWSKFRAFHAWAIGSGYRPGLCITRKQGARIYSPKNCRWATRAEVNSLAQHGEPSRRPEWTVEAFSETKGPTEWSRDQRCQVTLSGLLARLRGGWTPEDAISTPPMTPGKSHGEIQKVRAFGVRKSIVAWARDPRCKITETTLRERLRRGMPAEQALAAPYRRQAQPT